ncbi:MAG: CGNR zinc finger domain-containing protein [Nocardioidaceae bacterium]
MDFNSHLDAIVAVAVRLVNVATPGHNQGRDYVVPTGAELTRAVNDATGVGQPWVLSDAGARELAARAVRLRAVFEAVADGDLDRAAGDLNDLMAAVGVKPMLRRHDGEPWHLHFHARSEKTVDNWLAGLSFGLGVVVGSEHAQRLGVCVAQACDRVYVDVSRNGRRRFCSTACQSRTKAAAYRARQAPA